jgi:hypothetical protein
MKQSCANCNRVDALETENASLLEIIEGHRKAWDTFKPNQRIKELEDENARLTLALEQAMTAISTGLDSDIEKALGTLGI